MSRTVLPLRAVCLGAAILAAVAGVVRADERFSLEVAGNPAARSVAVLDGNALTITDGAGKSYLYVRTPKFDTADGRFIGYYCKAADQTLRWPVANTGKFLIGDPLGLQFRESRMEILAAGGRNANRPINPLPINPNRPLPGNPLPGNPLPGNPLPGNPLPGIGGNRPVAPPGGVRPGGVRPGAVDPGFNVPNRPVVQSTYDLAVLPGRGESLTAAYIDSKGRLQLYRGWDETWRRQPLNLRDVLVPGAPLALIDDPRGGAASTITVSARGELLEIAQGERSRPVTNQVGFVPGTHVALAGNPQAPSVVAVDDQGRILEIAIQDGQLGAVDGNAAGRFGAGVPLAIVPGQEDELFLIDRLGTLVGYRSNQGRWDGPEAIARGFPPGGHLTAAMLPGLNGQANVMVAAADTTGRLQAFLLDGNAWTPLPVGQVALPPGAPVALVRAADGLHLSAVTRDGLWIDWAQDRRGLVPREVGRGFSVGAPVTLLPHGGHLHGFCADSAGRLIAASWFRDAWRTALFTPEFDFAPRLVSRQIVANEPLPPVNVQFDNRHTEELFVSVIDELAPQSGSLELRIAPGQSTRQALQRDPGAVLEETWFVPTPNGGWVQDVRRTAIPPQPRYRVTAAANRTTYTYVDRRKKPGPLKDFDIQTPVSLGTFRLPPGADLRDGDTFDVYREAVARRNPGAAAFDLPRP